MALKCWLAVFGVVNYESEDNIQKLKVVVIVVGYICYSSILLNAGSVAAEEAGEAAIRGSTRTRL